MTGLTAAMDKAEGAYARVQVTTTNPPAAFTVFMKRETGGWRVMAHGADLQTEALRALGIPDHFFAWPQTE